MKPIDKIHLGDERLQTTDEHGNRVYIHPEDVKGVWLNRRKTFYAFLVLVYMVIPWIHVNGKQFILLDIPSREFHFGAMVFYAHDVPYLFFLVIGFAFLMAFITSVWGRVWCGWGCPQTVFLDLIYRPIERLIEGRSRRRMKLDAGPWSFEKAWKKTLKWFLFTLVSLHIAHSLLGYFVGTYELLEISLNNPGENWSLFLTMLFITGIFLFDMGWFREQFCIIMCPWGRIQSVFMDETSAVVGYDYNRGEPRKGQDPKEEGDCVNCFQCVRVCPTGIDIRRGTQLECIACTACIDACDNIMERLSRPKGLIRYTTEQELETGRKPSWLKVRSVVYLVIISIIFGSGYFFISHKNDLRVGFLRASKTPYQLSIKENLVSNHYIADLYYSGAEKINVEFSLSKEDQAKGIKLKLIEKEIILRQEKKRKVHVFFKFPKSILVKGIYKAKVNLKDQTGKVIQKEVPLVGPY